jgi:hypothetical protein
MKRHPSIVTLALHVGGDLPLWRAIAVSLHMRNCAECAAEARELEATRAELRAEAKELPAGLDWERLAGEMKANIRLGLAAGSIVDSPAPERRARASGWRLAVVAASLAFITFTGWMLQVPARPMAQNVVFETGPGGLAVRQHGRALTLLQPEREVVATTVSWDGGAKSSYIDSETGQVTIHNVMAQ